MLQTITQAVVKALETYYTQYPPGTAPGGDSTTTLAKDSTLIQVRDRLPSDQVFKTVGSGIAVSTEFVRPADTIAYASDDVVASSTTTANFLTFQNAARIAGGSGYITTARLIKSTPGITNASFRLWLYRSAPVSPAVPFDNAPFPLRWDNRANRIGFIDFPPMSTGGTGSDSASSMEKGINLFFQLPTGRDLFGLLITRAAYSAGSAESFFLELGVEQN